MHEGGWLIGHQFWVIDITIPKTCGDFVGSGPSFIRRAGHCVVDHVLVDSNCEGSGKIIRDNIWILKEYRLVLEDVRGDGGVLEHALETNTETTSVVFVRADVVGRESVVLDSLRCTEVSVRKTVSVLSGFGKTIILVSVEGNRFFCRLPRCLIYTNNPVVKEEEGEFLGTNLFIGILVHLASFVVAEGGEQTYSVKERMVDILRVIIPILVSGRQHQLLEDGLAEDVLDDVVVLGINEVVIFSIVLRDDKGVSAVFLLQFVGSFRSEADRLAGSYKRVVSTSAKH